MAVNDSSNITTAQRNIATAQASTAATRNSGLGTLDSPKEIQDRFLSLLIAQLKNQDPLSPMDNAQITQQMAQISTVQGISTLNDTLAQLVASQGSAVAQLIGRSVAVPGAEISLAQGQASGFALLDGAANNVTVEVLDSAGSVVRTLNLGAQPAGLLQFAWDGRDDAGALRPDGDYAYKVTATAGSFNIATETFTAARVQSVSLAAATGPTLLLDNGREVPASSVKRIF